MSTLGERALLWCDELANLTQTPGLMDRRYLMSTPSTPRH